MNTLNRFNYVNMEAWIEHWADDDFVWDCLVPNSHHSPHSHMDMVTALIAQTNSSSSSSSSSGPPHRSASMVLTISPGRRTISCHLVNGTYHLFDSHACNSLGGASVMSTRDGWAFAAGLQAQCTQHSPFAEGEFFFARLVPK